MNETREEEIARWQGIIDGTKRAIASGGVTHSAWVCKRLGWYGVLHEDVPPCVMLANEDDGYYIQVFKTRDELESFIAELHKVADEAWGPKEDK